MLCVFKTPSRKVKKQAGLFSLKLTKFPATQIEGAQVNQRRA